MAVIPSTQDLEEASDILGDLSMAASDLDGSERDAIGQVRYILEQYIDGERD